MRSVWSRPGREIAARGFTTHFEHDLRTPRRTQGDRMSRRDALPVDASDQGRGQKSYRNMGHKRLMGLIGSPISPISPMSPTAFHLFDSSKSKGEVNPISSRNCLLSRNPEKSASL